MQVELDGKKTSFRKGETILELAKRKGIEIPTLCYHPEFEPEARCRLCVVEVDGRLFTSCNTKVRKGMKILTDSRKVRKSRKITRALLERRKRIEGKSSDEPISWDHSKCILCRACVNVCEVMQEANAIEEAGKGVENKISPPFGSSITNSPCTFCGQCILFCDLDAINERDDTERLLKILKDKKKHVIVQTAPSIRASLGEFFGKPGSLVTGKMVTALRKLGFEKVFDTDFGADMTTFEETHEFLDRLKKNKNLPMFTSCCPAWIRFVEYNYPEFLKNLSTAKSPYMMFAAVAKTYYAKKFGINPNDLVIVSIMPCTAKKFEFSRPEMKIGRIKSTEIVITNREFGELLKNKKIDINRLKEDDFDDPLGVSSGGGAIYGVTGGVLETIIRSAKYIVGEKQGKIEFRAVRGLKGIRQATVRIGGKKVRVAVAHGLGNIKKILEMIKNGQHYDMVEMMACPGGCIGGGGQPKTKDKDIIKKRSAALYRQDRKIKFRIANQNPTIIKLYKEFMGKPYGKKARKYLHAKYKKKRVI